MADSDQQIVMLDPGTTIIENGQIVTVSNANEVDQDVNEDILKQALEEASKGFDENEGEYTGETVQVVADSNGQLTEASTVVGEDGITYTLVPAGDGTDTMHAVPTDTLNTVQTLDEQQLLHLQDHDKVMVDDSVVTADHDMTAVDNVTTVTDNVTSDDVTLQGIEDTITDEVSQHIQMVTGGGGDQQSRTVTVVTTDANGEPLGTSTNPIRIIQQGNQYTSMQQLSAEQLAQIMQVVQQQQLARNSAGGSTVLFNPQTQTRIVYKVIYPSELHGNKDAPGGAKKIVTGPRQITVPKSMVTVGGVGAFGRRQYKKRPKEEEEKFEGPELSKEEKEERKKHRPRTRSGRVSKPPKHMVKDYKHIHHLDWDEDYDDSDGGYSDFRLSEAEDEDDENSNDPNDKPFMSTYIGLLSDKPKEYKCDKCPKAYIGKAGLARHYRLYPEHGDAEDLVLGSGIGKNGLDGSLTDDSTQDSIGSASNQSQQTITSSTTSACSQPGSQASGLPAFTSVTALSSAQSVETTNAVDSPIVTAPRSFCSVTHSPTTNTTSTASVPSVGRPVRPGPGRPRGSRSRPYFYGETNAQKRKMKLRELAKQCTNEDLMEIVLPRLARVITLWEFLMMKVEKGRPARPNVQDVCAEFEELHKQVKKMCQEKLQPGTGQAVTTGPRCQLRDDAVARSLGFSAGTFAIKEKVPIEGLLNQPVRFKVVSSDSTTVQHKVSQPVKRVAVVPQEAPSPKKQRIIVGGREDSQNRTVVLHTNSTSPIQTVPGRSLLKTTPNIVLTSSNNVVISSPKAQSVVSNSGLMQPSPVTTSGQYSLIKVAHNNVTATSGTVQQPQQPQIVVTNNQQQQLVQSLGQTIVIKPDEGVKREEEQRENGQHEVVMQQQEDGVQEAAVTTEAGNLTYHYDVVVQENTQDGQDQEIQETGNDITHTQTDNNEHEHSEIQGHQIVEASDGSHVYLQQAVEQNGEGQVPQGEGENQLVVSEGDTTTQILLQQGEDGEHQIIEGANIFQTEDGLILIQNPDGTFQIHGNTDQPIPLETVQTLLAMDGQLQEGQQVLQVQEQEQMQVEEQDQLVQGQLVEGQLVEGHHQLVDGQHQLVEGQHHLVQEQHENIEQQGDLGESVS